MPARAHLAAQEAGGRWRGLSAVVGQVPGGPTAPPGLREPWSVLAGSPVPLAPTSSPEVAAFGFSWEWHALFLRLSDCLAPPDSSWLFIFKNKS